MRNDPHTIKYLPKKNNIVRSPLGYCDHNNSPEYCSKTDTPWFSAELSDLDSIASFGRRIHFQLGDRVTVKNEDTGNIIIFKCTSIDRDGSGEDIHGYNFEAIHGNKFPVNMLLIND